MFWRKRNKPKALTNEETRLGRVLLRMGVATEAQLTAAIEDARPLGEALVAHGVTDASTVADALRLQVMMRNGQAAKALLELRLRKAQQRKDQVTQSLSLADLPGGGS